MKRPPIPKRRQAGLTLIEMLVATVVALFATLVITQTFALSETYRRSGTSGGDASFSGAVGAYLMSRDLAVAGYGVNVAAYYGCTVSGSDQYPPSGPKPRSFTFPLAPVQIIPGANAQAPDTVWALASATNTVPGLITLSTPMAAPTDNYTVTSAFGVTKGDVLILAQAGNGACTLVEATNTPAFATSNQNVIQHASGVAGRFNPVGGFGLAYPANSVIFEMGAAPIVSRYYVQTANNNPNAGVPMNTLVVDQLVTGLLGQPVAANIVQLKALYGRDTVGDGAVHVWDTVTPTAAGVCGNGGLFNQWSCVLAVRVALAAQSASAEKPNPTTGLCSTTTQLPTVAWDDSLMVPDPTTGSTSTTTLDVSVTGSASGVNWTCFHYKTFHVTTSLRNLIWKPA